MTRDEVVREEFGDCNKRQRGNRSRGRRGADYLEERMKEGRSVELGNVYDRFRVSSMNVSLKLGSFVPVHS